MPPLPSAGDLTPAGVFCSNHPLIQHKLALLRSVETAPKQFREVVAEITQLLAYEATADLTTVDEQVVTPLTTTTCRVELFGRGLHAPQEGQFVLDQRVVRAKHASGR